MRSVLMNERYTLCDQVGWVGRVDFVIIVLYTVSDGRYYIQKYFNTEEIERTTAINIAVLVLSSPSLG